MDKTFVIAAVFASLYMVHVLLGPFVGGLYAAALSVLFVVLAQQGVR